MTTTAASGGTRRTRASAGADGTAASAGVPATVKEQEERESKRPRRFVIASGSLLGWRVRGILPAWERPVRAKTRTRGGPFRTAGALRSRDDR